MNLFFEPNGKIVGEWKGHRVKVMDAAMFNKYNSGVTVVREKDKLFLVKDEYVIGNVSAEGAVQDVKPYPYSWKPQPQPQLKVEVEEKVKEPISFSFSNYTTEVDNFFKKLADYNPLEG